MSVDALIGRSTNRKLKNVLILTMSAVAILVFAWLTEHPLRPPVFGATEKWISLPEFAETWVSGGDLIFCAGNYQVGAVDETGQLLWQRDTVWKSPEIRTFGDAALIYEPGGDMLILANRDGGNQISVPQGVDSAAPGPGETLAVITAGSGYLTETKCLDSTGAVLSSRGYLDRAETMLLFLENGALVSGAIQSDGTWLLRGEGPDILWERPVSEGPILDLRLWKDGFVLWTPASICFFRGDGTLVSQAPLDCDRVFVWDCDDDLAAVLAEQAGSRFLILAAPSGQVYQTEPISGDPHDLTISAGYPCVLDREAMLVYDETGRLRETVSAGACASRIESLGGAVLLIGNGRMLRHYIMN